MSGSFAEQDVVFWKVDYTFSPALPSTTGSVLMQILKVMLVDKILLGQVQVEVELLLVLVQELTLYHI